MLVNDAPNMAPIDNVSATPGQQVEIQLIVSDTETPAAELFVFLDPDEAPAGATIDNATRTLRWMVPASQPLNVPVRIVAIVTDKPANAFPALADAEEFLVNVLAANQAPVNTVPGAQTTPEDTDLVFSAANNNVISVSDPDAGTADLQVTLTVTNGDLTLSTTTGLTFSGDSDGTDDATMTFTGSSTAINAALEGLRFGPSPNFFGDATLTITTNDQGNTGVGGPMTDMDAVAITVTPVADMPGVTTASTLEDTQTTSGLEIIPNPVDLASVTHFKITNITGGTLFLNDGTTPVNNGDFITLAQGQAGLRFTPAANFTGNATFQIQASTSASDAGLGGALVTAMVTVLPVNDAPNLATISAKTVSRGEELMFTATATDVDAADVLTFSIDPDLAALGATIDPATGVFRWTPSATQALGPVTFRILAIDNGTPNALADSETFTITVTAENLAPVIAPIADQTVAEGAELSVAVMATDPDAGDVLTFSLAAGQFPTGATIDPATGVFRWTPAEDQGGMHSVTVVATDNRTPALSHSRTFMITVSEANQAPVLAAIGNRTATANMPVTFIAVATDPDIPANTLTFSLQGAPAGATIDPQTGAFTWTPAAAGAFTFRVIATDNGSPALTDMEEVTITVTAATPG